MGALIRPLHVSKFIPPPDGGIEVHVDTLLRSLMPDAQPTLIACEPAGRRERPTLPYRVVPARSHGTVASVSMSADILPLVRRELREGGSNLLHFHVPNPWGDLAALMADRNLPTVVTWHSDIIRQGKLLRLYRPLQRRVLQRVDRIVVFTPKHYESSEQLQQIDVSAKVVSIPVGIDFERLDGPVPQTAGSAALDAFANGRPVVLSVGRHVYYKGYGQLLEAMRGLRSDAVLVLVGTGPLSDALQRQAAELGLAGRVLFMGKVDEPTLVAALHRCDVFCLPSIEPSEAFGIASAEAMACGKPTVVCELGNGVNYLNQHGKTSLTVPPRDVPALRDALDALLCDDVLRLAMGRAARAWVRAEFSVATMREKTLALYRQLL